MVRRAAARAELGLGPRVSAWALLHVILDGEPAPGGEPLEASIAPLRARSPYVALLVDVAALPSAGPAHAHLSADAFVTRFGPEVARIASSVRGFAEVQRALRAAIEAATAPHPARRSARARLRDGARRAVG
jgi:hypothetical protein